MDLKDLEPTLRKIFIDLGKGRALTKMGALLVAKIKKRTRDGRGVQENLEKTHRLPKLKKPTVRIRKWLQRNGLLTGPGATPGKSGVNRSGKTLDSMTVKEKGRFRVEIKLDNDGEAVAKELLKINEKYQFMRVSNREMTDAIKKVMVPEITKTIKKLFP